MPQKNKKTIIDLLKFDLTKMFMYPHNEVGVEDTPAIQIVDYESKLEDTEFDVFDTMRFRVLFDKMNITGETHINVGFRCRKRRTNKTDAEKLVNYLSKFFGEDNAGKSVWSENDDKDFLSKNFNRNWSSGIGDNFVCLNYSDIRGLEMNILFVNNLLKNMGLEIEF